MSLVEFKNSKTFKEGEEWAEQANKIANAATPTKVPEDFDYGICTDTMNFTQSVMNRIKDERHKTIFLSKMEEAMLWAYKSMR